MAFSQNDLNIKKGFTYPLSVEVSGIVPRGSECYEYENNVTLEDRKVHNGYFLGVTAIVGVEEIDFAYKVKPISGRFRERYSISPERFVLTGGPDIIWVASLWRVKIYKNCCAKKNNGSACEYCIQNGFHLESPVIREKITE